MALQAPSRARRPHRKAAKVFERFYRGDAQPGGKGAGLGLSIAKELVEAHGSSIELQSVPGSGTTFVFAAHSSLVPERAAA